MARPIAGRVRISARLQAQSALHVGSGGEDVDTDLPLARNGQGRLYVPGTSLAGGFRAWFARRFGEDETRRVWGFQEDDRGHASLVLVEDGAVALPDGTDPEIRDGVGIDRIWSSAAAGIKHDRAVLPRGSEVRLEMTVEIPPGEDANRLRAQVGHMLEAAERGEIALGAAQTRGLGRLTARDVQILNEDWSSRDGVLRAIRGGSSVTARQLVQQAPALTLKAWPRLEVAIRWRPDGPVMVKASAEGVGVDALPLASVVGNQIALVLPGSSLKGALRTHGERIVRTVLGRDPSAEPNPRTRFLEQLEVPLVSTLFGSAAQERLDGDDGGGPLPGRGALAVDDCYAEQSVSLSDWIALVQAADPQEIYGLRTRAGLDHAQVAYHIAVDRWTGGAADGLLFTALEPLQVGWEPIRCRLDLTRIPGEERLPSVALLCMMLRDLASSRIPIGFASTRGYGAVQVDAIDIFGYELADLPQIAPLSGVTLEGGDLRALPESLRKALSQEWQQWCTRRRQGGNTWQ